MLEIKSKMLTQMNAWNHDLVFFFQKLNYCQTEFCSLKEMENPEQDLWPGEG